MTDHNELQIFSENIRILSERAEHADTQRQICVRQMVKTMTERSPAEEPPSLYRAFCRALPEATREDRAQLCLLLATSLPHSARLAKVSNLTVDEHAAPGSHGRIALVRNSYNEQAFAKFSTVVSNAKPAYPASFTAACEDVFDNRCEFCILPMENIDGGRLLGFYGMIDRYDLRICASCRLDSEDQSDSVRYALVGKSMPDRLPRQSTYCMEFSITATATEFPRDVLHAASVLGSTLLGLDSLPVPYNDGLQRFYFTLQATETSAHALDLYLSMEHTGYAPIGLYPMLP